MKPSSIDARLQPKTQFPFWFHSHEAHDIVIKYRPQIPAKETVLINSYVGVFRATLEMLHGDFFTNGRIVRVL